jgi:hypothetical protein
MRTTAKPVSVFAFAHPSCRICPFRRYRVSEVCHCGGFLLAFAASQKCRSDQSPATSKLLHECERSARDGLCLNGAPSLLARCRDFFGQGLRDDALSTLRKLGKLLHDEAEIRVLSFINAECLQLARMRSADRIGQCLMLGATRKIYAQSEYFAD